MYAPHVPLWAVTYHAFQTSSHGKYRLMAEKRKADDDESKEDSKENIPVIPLEEEKTPEQPPEKKQKVENESKEKRKIRTEILKKKREEGKLGPFTNNNRKEPVKKKRKMGRKEAEKQFDAIYDSLLDMIRVQFKDDSAKVEDALKIDEIAFNKALEEEESKIKQEERFDKTWEKALEKIRKRGEKLFKEKQELQKILQKDTDAFEKAIKKEEKEEEKRQDQSYKVISNIIDRIEATDKQETKEIKKVTDSMVNEVWKKIQKEQKEIVKKEKKRQKELSKEQQAAKYLYEDKNNALTNDLFTIDTGTKRKKDSDVPAIGYGDGFVQIESKEGVVEQLQLARKGKKTFPDAAVVKQNIPWSKEATKDRLILDKRTDKFYMMDGRHFKRPDDDSVQVVPMMQTEFFDKHKDNHLYKDTFCKGGPEIFMKSSPPKPTYPGEYIDGKKRSNMKKYTFETWRNNKKDGDPCPLNPAYIQMKSLLVNPQDILIAHQPGEGKTVNAILLAEMKRNQYIRKHKEDYNNKIRKWEFCRILVMASKSQILLQWQKAVCAWGFDPRHWIFQTNDHVYRSQARKESYPEWHQLTQKTKDFYEDIWEDMSVPKKLEDIQDELKKYRNDAVIDLENLKTDKKLKDVNLMTKSKGRSKKKATWNQYHRNMISGKWFSLTGGLSNKKSHYLIKSDGSKKSGTQLDDDEDYKRFKSLKEPGNFLCVLKKLEGDKLIVLIFYDKNSEYSKTLYKYIVGMLGTRTGSSNLKLINDRDPSFKMKNVEGTDITEDVIEQLKQCKSVSEMKSVLTKNVILGGLTSVDKFITKSHGGELVQHRYIAEKDVIFILDECHESLSSRQINMKEVNDDDVVVETTKKGFRPQTKVYFEYGKHTISNILVSATPMLADRPFKQLRIIAKFLNRETDFYGIGHVKGEEIDDKFEPYKLMNEKCDTITTDAYGYKYNEAKIARDYVKYKDVIDSLEGKITRVQYILNDEEFEEEMEKQGIDTYTTTVKTIEEKGKKEKICETKQKEVEYISETPYIRYEFDTNEQKYVKKDKVKLSDHIMEQYLFGNPSRLSQFKSSIFSKKDRLMALKEALKSLYLFRGNTFESPFPIKVPLGYDHVTKKVGYTKIERDIVRKYLSEHKSRKTILNRRIIPDMTTIHTRTAYSKEDNKAKYIFHRDLSVELKKRYDHIKGFYPIVMTILDQEYEEDKPVKDKCDESRGMLTLKKLQEFAFSVSDKWIVILNIPGDLIKEKTKKQLETLKKKKEEAEEGSPKRDFQLKIDAMDEIIKEERKTLASDHIKTALKQMCVGRYDAKKPTHGATSINKQTYDNADKEILTDEIKRFLNQDYSEIQWLRLRQGTGERKEDFKDHIVSIPGILSSRIEAIVLRIEECVANNKNVLVYDNNIEVLKAIEFALIARNNRRIYLQNIYGKDPDKEWLNEQIGKIERKWRKWDKDSIERDMKFIEDSVEYKEEDIEDDKNNFDPNKKIPTALNFYQLKRNIMEHVLGKLKKAKDEIEEDSDKYEYLAKLNESKRIMSMYKLKKPAYNNIEGYWDTKEKGLIKEKDTPWGHIPQTKKQWMNFTLNELRDTKKQDNIVKKIKSTITKSMLSGEGLPTDEQLFKAFHFYFKSTKRFINDNDVVDRVLSLAEIFMNGFFKKNIRGKKNQKRFIKSLKKIESLFDDRFVWTSTFAKDAISDFYSFAYDFYQMKMKQAFANKWWTNDIRDTINKEDIWRRNQNKDLEHLLKDIDDRKKKCKKRLKKMDKTNYYNIPKTYTVTTNDIDLLNDIAKSIGEDIDIPFTKKDTEMIQYAEYLFNVSSTEKLQDIKWKFGWQKFPIGGANIADYIYLTPLNRERMYGKIYVSLEKEKNRKCDWYTEEIRKETIFKKEAEKLWSKTKEAGEIFEYTNQTKIDKCRADLTKWTINFKKNKNNAPDDNTIRFIYNILETEKRRLIKEETEFRKETEEAIEQFIEKYQRIEELREFNTYDFSTPDDIVDDIILLEDSLRLGQKMNHAFEINHWKYLDTSTFTGEYFNNNMNETESREDTIVDDETKTEEIHESSKDQESKPREEKTLKKKSKGPGRLKKSISVKQRNPFLRPHPLNSTMVRKTLKDNIKNTDISDINETEWRFSCLRQNERDDSFINMKKRILSQKRDESRYKVSFGMLTGPHAEPPDRQMYKMAFECGMIDCLLMNKVCTTGIDFSSTRESECIISACEKLPGTHDQFVGRMVRRNSHIVCPKEFRRVSYHTIEETISDDDKKYVVSGYHMFPSETEGRLFDVSKNAPAIMEQRSQEISGSGSSSRSSMMLRGVVHSMVTHAHSDEEDYVPSDSESESDEEEGVEEDAQDMQDLLIEAGQFDRAKRGEIKEWIDELRKRLGWTNTTNVNKLKDLKMMCTAQYTLARSDDERREAKNKIFRHFNTRRDRFKPLGIDPARMTDKPGIFDHIGYLTQEYLWKKRKYYYNITEVPVYKNHAFYSPYELLESKLEYEYGPRLWNADLGRDELDQGGLQIKHNWNCYVCNFESDRTICAKCGATGLDKYYKMEPFYLDDDLLVQLDKSGNRNYDKKHKKIFEHNRMVLNQTNLDLTMRSVEHVYRKKKDMIVDIPVGGTMHYYQRIKTTDECNYDRKIDSAIDIIYGDAQDPKKSDWVKVEKAIDDNNYESDVSIQSEYEDNY